MAALLARVLRSIPVSGWFLLLLLRPNNAAAATSWTWASGPRTASAPLSSAQPAARCCAQSWTASAKLYLFGGSSDVFLGDMWSFDPAEPANGWVAVPGGGSFENNTGGNATTPSARSYAVTWTVSKASAAADELWMWGGFGAAKAGDVDGHLLTDMWRWKVNSSSWEKVSQGRSNALRPPPRNWANFWSTNSGQTLYIHSGMGGSLTPWGGFAEPFSDLWRFDVVMNDTTNESGAVVGGAWTKVYDYSRSDPGVHYDDLPSQKRSPGYRSNAYTAVAPNGRGDLWLYGGEGGITQRLSNGTVITTTDGDFQDVWRFNVRDQRWSHVAGPRTAMGGPPHIGCSSNVSGACEPVYGVKGMASNASLPPAEHAGVIFRELASSGSSFFFFGGENGSEAIGMRNGLWRFDLDAAEWAWVSGAKGYNGAATYGSIGVPSATNTPGARYAGQGWVVGGQGWLFGGYGLDANRAAGYLSDMWSFEL
mgnify:CR=1 FL=1